MLHIFIFIPIPFEFSNQILFPFHENYRISQCNASRNQYCTDCTFQSTDIKHSVWWSGQHSLRFETWQVDRTTIAAKSHRVTYCCVETAENIQLVYRETYTTIFYTKTSAVVEQSATTDQGRLLTTDISAGDQVSSFPSVIWLTEVWRCLC